MAIAPNKKAITLLNKERSPSKHLHHEGDSETGFLRKYFVLARRFGKKPSFFVGVYEIIKLQAYKIYKTVLDWNNFTPLIGTTYGGRTLKIIFQLKPNNIVRLITEWPI